jgi:hypothetical protein
VHFVFYFLQRRRTPQGFAGQNRWQLRELAVYILLARAVRENSKQEARRITQPNTRNKLWTGATLNNFTFNHFVQGNHHQKYVR